MKNPKLSEMTMHDILMLIHLFRHRNDGPYFDPENCGAAAVDFANKFLKGVADRKALLGSLKRKKAAKKKKKQ
jgi:hypothetical protein